MNKKTKNRILVILLVLILGIVTWFFVFLNSQQQTEIVERVRESSPFGEIRTNNNNNEGDQDLNDRGNSDSDGDQNTTNPDSTDPEPDVVPLLPRLQRISSIPTGGFQPLVTITQEEISDITISEEGETIETTEVVDVENHSVRYASILDGTVYESFIDNTSLEQETVVGNFIPNSEQIHFSKDGNFVGFQYWDNDSRVIETYLTEITKRSLDVDDCPFNFERGLEIGDSNDSVLELHQFLNREPKTRVSETGINSPGNEGSTVTEATIAAIKNFQTLHELEIDGVLGRGTKAVMESVCKDQQTQLAQEAFDANPEKYDIRGSFASENIESLSYAPESNRVFYIQPKNNGVEGVIRNLDTGVQQTIFNSPHSEWLHEWNYEGEIILTTKPSYQAIGYSYSLDPNTGDFFKIIEGRALTVTGNHDGTYLFGTRIVDNNVDSFIVERESGLTSLLLTQTFPEKCVWSRSNISIYCFVPNNLAYQHQYPDIWYQGIERFQDTLWEINAETLDESLVSDIVVEYNADLDVERVDIDREGDYIYFINKTQEDLWSYRIN
jgi:hypothetical protein